MSKNITIQITNSKNKVLEEDQITIEENDKLIFQINNKYPLDKAKELLDIAREMLNSKENNVIVLPQNIKIKVLKIDKE